MEESICRTGGEQGILFRGLKTKYLRDLSMENKPSNKGRLVQKVSEVVSALLTSKSASSASYFFYFLSEPS